MTDFRCLSQNVDQRCLGLHVGVGKLSDFNRVFILQRQKKNSIV